LTGEHSWPWWWSAVLALAWAPLLWVPEASRVRKGVVAARLGVALASAVLLTFAGWAVDHAPIGAGEQPLAAAGGVALAGMVAMYVGMVVFQIWPHAVIEIRRWVYAGFYMDEGYTHWVLRIWPTHWAAAGHANVRAPSVSHEPAYRGIEP
jgi:NAD(P)H-quinone oxidoreductase subunit 5